MEFAFVLPIFLLLVFGIVEIGRGFMTHHVVTNAARSGCRVGILPNKRVSDVTAAVDHALANQGITGYSTTVAVAGAVASDSTTISSTQEIAVSVSVPAKNVSWLPWHLFLPGTASIKGQFTLARE